MQDVQILAVDQKTAPDPQGKPVTANVVTLLVNPDDAEKAVLAAAQGSVHFVLRNGTDHDRVSEKPIVMNGKADDPAPKHTGAVVVHKAAAPAAPAVKPYEIETVQGTKRARRASSETDKDNPDSDDVGCDSNSDVEPTGHGAGRCDDSGGSRRRPAARHPSQLFGLRSCAGGEFVNGCPRSISSSCCVACGSGDGSGIAPNRSHAIVLSKAVAEAIEAKSAAMNANFENATPAEQQIHMTVGRTIFIDTKHRLTRVYVTDPAALNSYTLNPNQVVLTALKTGTSTLLVWDESGASQAYIVSADLDLDSLSKAMKDAFPAESIEVHASEGRVLLTGFVGTEVHTKLRKRWQNSFRPMYRTRW